jgi:hypothetical protein
VHQAKRKRRGWLPRRFHFYSFAKILMVLRLLGLFNLRRNLRWKKTTISGRN